MGLYRRFDTDTYNSFYYIVQTMTHPPQDAHSAIFMGPFHHPAIVKMLVSVVWSLKTKLHSGLDHTNQNLNKMIAFTVVVAQWALDVFSQERKLLLRFLGI